MKTKGFSMKFICFGWLSLIEAISQITLTAFSSLFCIFKFLIVSFRSLRRFLWQDLLFCRAIIFSFFSAHTVHCDGVANTLQAKKRKHLSAYEVSEIILSKGLRDQPELLAFSNQQREEGKTDLAEFIVNRGKKVVNEVIATAWEMESAQKTQKRQSKTHTELLNDAHQQECTCTTNSEWHHCALQVLARNNIAVDNFANCVKELLMKGRGKFRNILLTGPANCGKTFLLNLLNKVFTFTNPACTSFAWVGAEKADVVFLNDFRWSTQIIAWHDLLVGSSTVIL